MKKNLPSPTTYTYTANSEAETKNLYENHFGG